jgi:hypothetical protein
MKPSVSKLIDMLNKPGLIKWANKMGFKGVDVVVFKDSARERGSSRHKAIEDFAAGVLCEDEEINLKMAKFFSDKKIIDTEVSFETDYFTGRYDIKLCWNDLTFICDYKSSQRIYFETKLQLAAYRMAFPSDGLAVIHFPDLLMNPISINMDMYSEFLITLSKLYELKQRIENGK